MQYLMAVGFILFLVTGYGYAATPPEPPPSDEIWPLVAESHIIATGTLTAPVTSIQIALDWNAFSYVELDVALDKALKGSPPASIRVRWYTQPGEDSPSPNRVIALDGRKVLIFLIEVYDPLTFTSKIYFAGHTPRALSDQKSAFTTRVRREIDAQRSILSRFHDGFPPEKEPLYKRVKQLIDKTTQKETQMDAFRQLEQLGLDSVPAMIMLMDDRRDLPFQSISLLNPPGHWEGLRHYGPRKVVDAISAILNQLTGKGFGFIYNGGSDRERQEAVDGWRIYLHYWKKGHAQPVAASSR